MKILVFTFAPAGLGHLRVTDALIHARPENMEYVLVGSHDPFVTKIHKLTSNNPLAKKIFEASQYGALEDLVTNFYIKFLEWDTESVWKKIKEIVEQRPEISEMVVVATHFGLAHQIGFLKERIANELKVKIKIVVQVTDDTSQQLWVVKYADLTMVPSAMTKDALSKYALSKGISFNCAVSPYPLSPVLSEKLSRSMGLRESALTKDSKEFINVMIPISGAAVGLEFLTTMMKTMDRLSSRFRFWVVTKRTARTKKFLSKLNNLRWVQMITGRNDSETVNLYEKIYSENLIHLEITKPSEQLFKALIPPTEIGGSILCFTASVGRQEKDNINFLLRHGLLPETAGTPTTPDEVPTDKVVPRGVVLPEDPKKAAEYLNELLLKGELARMAKITKVYAKESMTSTEISDQGSSLFWQRLILERLI